MIDQNKKDDTKNIPLIATKFQPKNDDLVDNLLGKPTRRIFIIPINFYTSRELQKLIEFYEYSLNQNYNFYPKNTKNYSYHNIFRQLQGSDFNVEKAFNDVTHEIIYKNEKLPFTLTTDIEKVLNSGFVYIHGRDNHFRPLIFMNPGKFFDTQIPIESWENVAPFIMEYLISECIIPGKIENWNIIVDFGEMEMSKIPFQLKDLFGCIKGVYRCRLYKLFLLNMNSVFSFVWSIVKFVIGPTIEAKACKVETNDGQYDLLFQFINRSQVEKKYGGTAENLGKGKYFPPNLCEGNFFCKENCESDNIENGNVDFLKDYESNEIFYEASSV